MSTRKIKLEGDWTEADEEAIIETLAEAGLRAEDVVERGEE